MPWGIGTTGRRVTPTLPRGAGPVFRHKRFFRRIASGSGTSTFCPHLQMKNPSSNMLLVMRLRRPHTRHVIRPGFCGFSAFLARRNQRSRKSAVNPASTATAIKINSGDSAKPNSLRHMGLTPWFSNGQQPQSANRLSKTACSVCAIELSHSPALSDGLAQVKVLSTCAVRRLTRQAQSSPNMFLPTNRLSETEKERNARKQCIKPTSYRIRLKNRYSFSFG